MYKDNRGFTLIELLATIVVLALVLSITAYVAIDVIRKSKEKSYDVTVANIEANASNYVDESELSYIDNNDGTEYQCVTVKNLVDKGFLKTDVTESMYTEDSHVSLADCIYIERNANKAVAKVAYCGIDDAARDKCNAFGNITLIANPAFGVWSKSKVITINYKIKGSAPDLSYQYLYDYSGISNLESEHLNTKNVTRQITVTSNGRLEASINSGSSLVAYVSKDIDKIDNVGPVITSDYNGVNPVKTTAVIPLKVTDIGIGLDENSFTKDDIEVTINGTKLASSDLTLTNKHNGDYELKINKTDDSLTGKAIIKIAENKVLDKLGNGNNDTEIESVTFSNSYMIIYNCAGGTNGPDNVEVMNGQTYTISTDKCKMDGYMQTGWYDSNNNKRDGESGTWNQSSSLELKAKYEENKVTIKYNLNGGILANPHGASVTVENDFVKYGGTTILHELKYGGKLDNAGLWNWDNPSYLNVTKDEYSVSLGAEWNTKSDGTGTSYDQKKVYTASDFCPDIAHTSCEVVLYLNWENTKKPIRIYYHTNGGSVNSKFKLKGNWLIQNTSDTSLCKDVPETNPDAYLLENADNVMFKDSDTYCYQIGYASKAINFWNYNSTNYLKITKDSYSAVSKKEYYTKSNGSTIYFNHNTDYTYAYLRQYCRVLDEYYELDLYVNWADGTNTTNGGNCCQYPATLNSIGKYICPSGGHLLSRNGGPCWYKSTGSCQVGYSVLC